MHQTQVVYPAVVRSAMPRPFLKWAGGKGQLLPQYDLFFPSFSRYHEPFLGGGAVFFHLLPQRARITDINPELVNVYRCVRDEVAGLIQQLEYHRQHHSPDYYYQIRSWVGSDDLARAARLIYLNKTCFNGLYRENKRGQFNVPIGRYKNPGICDPALLSAASACLQKTVIDVMGFDQVLRYARSSKDFVYFDPPYYPISATSRFTAYNRFDFTEADQIKLCEVVSKLTKRGVKVMLSNSDCPFVRELYQDFQVHTIHSSRSINAKASTRGKITEVLVTNYEISSQVA
jgi:DNA adenine methylase